MADFANTLPKSHDVLPSARSDPFLLAVAHDLRSRMTAISGFAHTLRRGDIDASMRTLLFDRLGVNVVAMDRLLSGLLDLERARSPNGLRLELIDLAEVARNTVASQPAADNRIRVDTKPVLANADAALVDRIIDNLIVNALKHTSNGSPVWVRVRPRSDGGLIVVDDAGPGVPDGEKQRVFEAFVSGGQTRGSGVGLSLVARFAEMHGGRAWVQDRPGGGASFRVFIPDGTE
ncbi:MAG TPA: HAMP domain-containing sensor histidine kinase [Actinomycetota bacterium]